MLYIHINIIHYDYSLRLMFKFCCCMGDMTVKFTWSKSIMHFTIYPAHGFITY